VLVTGAAGSIGSEICRQLAGFPIRRLICFDVGETPMHTLRLELEEHYPSLHFFPVIGDVCNKARISSVFTAHHPEIVFHAAAYKHVPLMEENPCEAIRVNVYGTQITVDCAVRYGGERFVMISTDKAVNPTSIMGCSKRIAEIYVQSLNRAIVRGKMEGHTKFVTTRFGNVLGSNGSVIPRFRDQIRNGGPVTVTHPDIIRYFMTIPEACRLVLEACTMGNRGEIFVFEMGTAVKIVDLARRMIELSGLKPDKDIPIVYTGLRPGEKLYEELLSDEELTIPTPHEKIRVASVREYDYDSVVSRIELLVGFSYVVNIPELVKEMKHLVPEYKSQNSEFQKYDQAGFPPAYVASPSST
jgi:FlaA1/EpsC-like NDP-sugar epimerase